MSAMRRMLPGGLIPLAVGSVAIATATSYFLWKWLRKRVSVKGKVVLITGASSGIGRACATAFFQEGAQVILCSRNISKLNELKIHLESLVIREVKTLPPVVVAMDLDDPQSLHLAVDDVIKRFKHIDILINNAGVSCRGAVVDIEMDVYHRVMQLNFLSHVLLTKLFLPGMIDSGYGHIVAVSSLQGKIALPYRSAYSASKHAVQAFFDSLRGEVRDKGIRVTVVSPDYVKTNLSKNIVSHDGRSLNVVDKDIAEGLDPIAVAHGILHAVQYQSDEYLPGKFSHMSAIYLRLLCPALFAELAYRRGKKEVYGQQLLQKYD